MLNHLILLKNDNSCLFLVHYRQKEYVSILRKLIFNILAHCTIKTSTFSCMLPEIMGIKIANAIEDLGDINLISKAFRFNTQTLGY